MKCTICAIVFAKYYLAKLAMCVLVVCIWQPYENWLTNNHKCCVNDVAYAKRQKRSGIKKTKMSEFVFWQYSMGSKFHPYYNGKRFIYFTTFNALTNEPNSTWNSFRNKSLARTWIGKMLNDANKMLCDHLPIFAFPK